MAELGIREGLKNLWKKFLVGSIPTGGTGQIRSKMVQINSDYLEKAVQESIEQEKVYILHRVSPKHYLELLDGLRQIGDRLDMDILTSYRRQERKLLFAPKDVVRKLKARAETNV